MDPDDPIDVDPKELLELQEKEKEQEEELAEDKERMKLNTLVAITVALLATFLGICKIKDSNIVLEMQHVQATSIDNWNFYQAKNIRESVYQSTADQLSLLAQASTSTTDKAAFAKAAKTYKGWSKDQDVKKAEPMKLANKADKDYDEEKEHHDIFDMEEALISIAVSLFAVTALTQKRWLFGVGLIPTAIGVVLGMAGLLNIHIPLGAITKFLG